MADRRKQYVVTLGGLPHTLLLSPEAAAGYGDRAVEVKAAPEPAVKAKAPANKSRKPANKAD